MFAKTFTCDDGSGTFDMVLFVRLTAVSGSFTDTFRWMITDGTGSYESLAGLGTVVGVTTNGQLVDHYIGHVGTED